MTKINIVKRVLFLSLFLLCFKATVVSGAVIKGISVSGNTDIPGGDYDNISNVISIEQCVSFCAADQRCRAFSYVSSQRACWLKDRVNASVRHIGVTAGKKLSPPPAPAQPDPQLRRPVADMEILYGTDMPGFDFLNFVAPNYKKCAKACEKNDKCRVFTYNKVAKMCWLKFRESVSMKKPGYVSGIKHKRRVRN